MKIGICHSIYKPQTRGGAEVVVEAMAQGLKSRGHEVFIITAGYQNQMLEIDGLKVYQVKHFNLFNFFDLGSKPVWQRLIWHLLDAFNDVQTWRVFKIVNSEKPDLVITNSLKGIGYEIPKLLKILKIRHIHIIHDMQLIHPSGLLPETERFSWLEKVYLYLCRWLFGSPNKIVFPSAYIQSVYQRFKFFPSAQLVVKGNSLPSEIKLSIRRSFQPGQEITFAFVGQAEEYKGLIDLIKAINDASGHWRLLVAGEGSALAEAKKIALDNKKIKFFGRLDSDGLEQKIWSETDILINPSRVPESFGMSVIEAYARGIPVLASKIGALESLVKENQTGWFFKPKDQFDLKRLIEFILSNQDNLTDMKKSALKESGNYQIGDYLTELLK